MTIKFWVLIDIDEFRNCANSPVTSLLLGSLIAHDALSQFLKLGEHLLLLVSQISISTSQRSP
ncbi:hypothetical protein P998_03577 [Pseudomonas aeruginosa E2]|nr:hypothetical protein Q010_06033 [Pseudomonas aeruginosa 19660]ERX36493.1 hypothetical protein Q010_03749 [Pseudomonas aeruginosa 19660]ERX75582.1 hypothetical protein P998_03577 [Pseudomonas aeruginosa E2]